jgi:S-methylmethionine-dependent homocysteine/selenocysteine methylase
VTQFRQRLPQIGDDLFVTDGGIETTLIFDEGFDLPHFAAFHLLASQHGTQALDRYFRGYAELAHRAETGIVLETPTWRASPDWGSRLGYSTEQLGRANRRAVELVERMRATTPSIPIVVSGCVGPRGDGYLVMDPMSIEGARDYHGGQISTFADTSADMIGALTMTYVAEATGVALAARDAGMPVAIAFTVETDGQLPSGQPLDEAIAAVDAATDGYPAYYMVNCAHPTHFAAVLTADEPSLRRVRGIRANASALSHSELDEADELDAGDPNDLAARLAELRGRLPQLTVLGGCCGTNQRHIQAIARATGRSSR